MDQKVKARLYRVSADIKRREENALGRPVLWGCKAGILAFCATIVLVSIQCGFTWVVLERGAIAILVFSVAGFVLGRYVERAPRISFDLGGLGSEKGQVSGRIPVDKLKPGMILSEPVLSAEGDILVPAGVPLTDALVSVLFEYGIEAANVVGSANGEIGHAEEDARVGSRTLAEGQERVGQGTGSST
jgi:hypothetical protein